jgi:hypothetical protein
MVLSTTELVRKHNVSETGFVLALKGLEGVSYSVGGTDSIFRVMETYKI